jgi:hypothetical protein
LNVIETINGELYKAVPHYPSRSYEKEVYYERTPQEIADHIDDSYRKCEERGVKNHSYKLWIHLTNQEREYYLKCFKRDLDKIVGKETVDVVYPQSGWFVVAEKWCRIFPMGEVVKVWDERK